MTQINTSGWRRVGHQLGSNPGGKYQDDKGNVWYLKHSKSEDHAKNEHLAHHLYKLVGSPVTDYELINHKGSIGTGSKWVEGMKPFNRHDDAHLHDAKKHFATHAWLGNWDSVGLDYDNQVHHPTKGLMTVDTGGSLLYRAQGAPKGHLWNHHANEFETLRDPEVGPAGKVFHSMTSSELHDSAKRLKKATDEKITDLVMRHGPGKTQDKRNMISTLIARRDNILKKAMVE